MPLQQVNITVEGRTYSVTVAPNLLPGGGAEIRRLTAAGRVAVVTDAHLAACHLPTLRASLDAAGFDVIPVIVPPGEISKSLAGIAPIYDRLLGAKIDRKTLIIGLGGGVVTDLAGFVAATVLRGVPYVAIPTSLLAMVDASVGGKTGINHPAGKNLIGAFYQPSLVLIDPQTLRSLPPRELRGGLAECVKHDVIRDADGFARLEASIDRALSLDVDYLADLITHNVRIKAAVVAADPTERGERAHLNFGHTFGHAIESVSDYAYGHGEAVSLGMVAACRLANRLGMFAERDTARVVALLQRIGLPTGGMTLDPDAILDRMAGDKKAEAGRLRFILPTRIGHVTVRDDVPPTRVREVVKTLADQA